LTLGGDLVGGAAINDHANKPTLSGKKENPGNLVISYLLINNTLLRGTVSTDIQPLHSPALRPRRPETILVEKAKLDRSLVRVFVSHSTLSTKGHGVGVRRLRGRWGEVVEFPGRGESTNPPAV